MEKKMFTFQLFWKRTRKSRRFHSFFCQCCICLGDGEFFWTKNINAKVHSTLKKIKFYKTLYIRFLRKFFPFDFHAFVFFVNIILIRFVYCATLEHHNMHMYLKKISIFHSFSESQILVGVVRDTSNGLKHVEWYLATKRLKTNAVQCFSRIKKKNKTHSQTLTDTFKSPCVSVTSRILCASHTIIKPCPGHAIRYDTTARTVQAYITTILKNHYILAAIEI